ncbi:Uncharacterised protein [Streptococcus agalactiae]|nr:Uncharacterised protein [Streptococcus agalactiae]
MFSVNDIVNFFNNYSEIAVILSLFISIIIAILGVIPSVFVTGANILFFGPIFGFLYLLWVKL